MKLLAVDTSGPVCGVAVLEEGKIRVMPMDTRKKNHKK